MAEISDVVIGVIVGRLTFLMLAAPIASFLDRSACEWNVDLRLESPHFALIYDPQENVDTKVGQTTMQINRRAIHGRAQGGDLPLSITSGAAE